MHEVTEDAATVDMVAIVLVNEPKAKACMAVCTKAYVHMLFMLIRA